MIETRARESKDAEGAAGGGAGEAREKEDPTLGTRAPHLLRQSGLRFSMKARTPSCASSVFISSLR